jgi:Fe-S-cluster containining protein
MNPTRTKINNQVLQDLINNTIHGFSDCSLCNLCCIDGILHLDESDIKKISKHLKISPKSLVEHYTNYNLKTGEIKINMPCSFLKNNKCIIYQVRPEICRDYPVFVQNNDIVYVYGIETCAIATIFLDAYADFLAKYYPDCYEQLEKNLDKDLPLKKDDMINMQFSKEHFEIFIKWINKSKNIERQ